MSKKIKPTEILQTVGGLGGIMQKMQQAELSFKMTKKTLELVNEINQKINTIIIPKIEEIEKCLKE